MVSRNKTVPRLLRAMRFEGIIPLIPAKLTKPLSEDVEVYSGGDHSQNNCDSYAPPPSATMLQYEVEFQRALLTFRHQIVFDPETRCATHLAAICETSTLSCLRPYLRQEDSTALDFSFLGTLIDNSIACGIADGLLDPSTKLPFNIPTRLPMSISLTMAPLTTVSSHFPVSKVSNKGVLGDKFQETFQHRFKIELCNASLSL